MLWEEIMKNSPTMKKILEDKITEEINKASQVRQQDIDKLSEVVAYQEIENRLLRYELSKLKGGE